MRARSAQQKETLNAKLGKTIEYGYKMHQSFIMLEDDVSIGVRCDMHVSENIIGNILGRLLFGVFPLSFLVYAFSLFL